VYFYAGQWWVFTPALTGQRNGGYMFSRAQSDYKIRLEQLALTGSADFF
jgi:hypothetical protein